MANSTTLNKNSSVGAVSAANLADEISLMRKIKAHLANCQCCRDAILNSEDNIGGWYPASPKGAPQPQIQRHRLEMRLHNNYSLSGIRFSRPNSQFRRTSGLTGSGGLNNNLASTADELKTFNDWADFWRYNIGVNLIPANTKRRKLTNPGKNGKTNQFHKNYMMNGICWRL